MKKVIFWISVIVVVGLYGGLGVPALFNINDTYGGHEVFQSEREYGQFKQALVDANATWGDNDGMEVLASIPPIIVSFNVDVKNGYQFPYGEEKQPLIAPLCMIFVLIVAAAWGVYSIGNIGEK